MPRIPPVLLLLPLLIGAQDNGCKGCRKQPDVDENAVVDGNDGVQDVSSALQIVSLDPARVSPGSATQGLVFGAGFEAGAKAMLGEQALSTDVQNDNQITVQLPALDAGTYDLVITNPDGATSTLRRALTVALDQAELEACRRVVVYFDTDKDGLTDQAKRAVDTQVPCFKARTGRIRVEGHADERGTTDYNLGLGQRRAHSVGRHLSGAGVAGSRLDVRSWGEERPAATGSGERQWAQNRRVEILAE